MSRHNGLSRVYASVSVTAILGLLAGCSQPASYATVDLGGSYGNGTPQAYSARSGLPVYQSTQVYTTPAATPPTSQSQLVYLDAPGNQVASLSPYSGGYGQPLQQSVPTFDSVVQGPFLTDETILRSDGYIDTGLYGGVETATLSPGAGSIGLDRMPIVTDVPQYLPAPIPYSAPVETELLPPPSPIQGVELLPLAAPTQIVGDDYTSQVPLYAPIATPIESAPLDLMQSEPQDFAGFPSPPARNDVAGIIDYYDLREEQQDGAVVDARLPAVPQFPVQEAPVATYTAPGDQNIALPPASQSYPRPYEALPPGFFPTYEFPSGGDLISEAPAVAEPVQVAELAPLAPISEVFTVVSDAPIQQIAEVQQATGMTLIGQAYTIRPGDTLYAIARKHGITPLEIAQANGMPLAGTIYPGDVLTIPSGGISGKPETLGDAPVVVLQSVDASTTDSYKAHTESVGLPFAEAASVGTYTADLTDHSVDMINIEELARMFKDREAGVAGAEIPIISAQAGDALRGQPDLTPTELISEPVGALTTPTIIPMQELAETMAMPVKMPGKMDRVSYAWPVRGEVYRLERGGIEIHAVPGKSVAATAAGRVVHVENGPRGVLVVIEHDDGWRSLTLGLTNATVEVDQRVSSGMMLGNTGDHRIRFELRDNASNVAETLSILQS